MATDENKNRETRERSGIANRDHERLIGYQVQDNGGAKIGTVHNLWTDDAGQAAFLGIKAGWLGLGKNHVVPVHTAQANDRERVIRLPFEEARVKDAPSFDADAELNEADQGQIYRYYGLSQPSYQAEPQARTAPAPGNENREGATIQLSEEQVKIGKREVSAGGIRLRKIVRTETVQQPVELKREEIVVERVPASGKTPAGTVFEAEDVFIPLRREEAVVQKEARVREEVRVSKKTKTERQDIAESIRKEEVEIEGGDKPRFPTEPGRERPPTERYEPKERGKQR